MRGHYSQLLEMVSSGGLGERGKRIISFREDVLRRYREVGGPWRLHKGDVTLYYWTEEGPEKLIVLEFMESKDLVRVHLRDLAVLPKSEQDHWKRFEEGS